MTQTVCGPTAMEQRPEDLAAAARRALIQACFHENDPAMTQSDMLKNNVSVQEMSVAMDYRIHIVDWMRLNKFPDGFQGLKVWSDSEIKKFSDHANVRRASGENALGLKMGPITNVQAQAALDTEHARMAVNPAYKSAYLQ